jgi:hypothetical protein
MTLRECRRVTGWPGAAGGERRSRPEFARQPPDALEDGDLRRYAIRLGLDIAAFDRDRPSKSVLERIQRDVDSGLASGQVLRTRVHAANEVVGRHAQPRQHRVAASQVGAGLLQSQVPPAAVAAVT